MFFWVALLMLASMAYGYILAKIVPMIVEKEDEEQNEKNHFVSVRGNIF